MSGFGSISGFPARQILAVTGMQAKGLDRLVNDPGAALRQLGEQSLTGRAEDANLTQRPAPIPTASDRSLSGAVVRSAIEASRADAENSVATQKPEQAAAEENASQQAVVSDDKAADGLEKARANVATPAANPAAEAEAGGDDERGPNGLTPDEETVVRDMRGRDREVRAHELAHKNTGGRYAGAISLSYDKGPDGQQYAVAGSVPIDMSPEASPEATIAKMRIVAAAALAPADPSGPDRGIAQAAQGQIIQASADASAERQAEAEALREDARADEESGAAGAFGDAESEPGAENTAGVFAANDPDNPYKVLDAISGGAFGERDDAAVVAA
jgi:SprA family protein